MSFLSFDILENEQNKETNRKLVVEKCFRSKKIRKKNIIIGEKKGKLKQILLPQFPLFRQLPLLLRNFSLE